ncbi:MAG TPA: cupin domain-containing protein [Myxococcota bacterium]|nr:cupin domain-containing protein [Myxococcota bacterium]
MRDRPIASLDVEARRGQTVYPEPFARWVAGRTKRKLGDVFGLRNFGINLTHLEPGAASALFHSHAVQDEFVFVLEGHPTVAFGEVDYQLSPGDCMGFKAGTGIAHQLINRTSESVTYLEIGDRSPGDHVVYPRDDIAACLGADGAWIMTRKDGTPY